MRKFLNKTWIQVYEILENELEEMSIKRNESGSVYLTFKYKGIRFEDSIGGYSFDLRSQKKEYLGCSIFNFVRIRATSENWDKNGRHEHYNLLNKLYDTFFDKAAKAAINLQKHADAIGSKIYELKNKQKELLINQAKLYPVKLLDFTDSIEKAIEKLKEAGDIVKEHQYAYNDLIHNLYPDAIYSIMHELEQKLQIFK